jgi:hypothetical protein
MKTTFIQGSKVRRISPFERVWNKVQAFVMIAGIVFFISFVIRLILDK